MKNDSIQLQRAAPLAVAVRNVTRSFGDGAIALEQFSLDVPAGQFLSIIGPSGCGKSTLLRMIAGLDRPTSGELTVDRDEIAYVFQDAHLLPWRSVLRNVALPLELAGVGKDDRLTRAAQALGAVGLGTFTHRYPAQLSGGQRMRVSLARAMVTRPRLLLLDEPFAALDEITRHSLDDQLRRISIEQNITVIFVTHSILEATYLSDRAIVLSTRPGRIVLDKTLELPRVRTGELRADPSFATQMRELFLALESPQSISTTKGDLR